MSGGLFGYSPTAGSFNFGTSGLAGDAEESALDAKTRAVFLEERLDHLALVCMAMWSLIQDKTDATEEDLLERVKQIDLMDGKADGKASRTIQKCPQCGRVMSPRHRKCIYCGAERLEQSAFDDV